MKSPSIDKLEPITENASEKLVKLVSHDKEVHLSTNIEGSVSSTGPPYGSETVLQSLQSSKSLNTVQLQNSKSTSLAPFDAQKQAKTTKTTNKKSTSLQEVQPQWSDLLLTDHKSSDGVDMVPILKEPVTTAEPSKERSLGELLRSLATEELASLTQNILSDEKSQSEGSDSKGQRSAHRGQGSDHEGQNRGHRVSESSDEGSSTITEYEPDTNSVSSCLSKSSPLKMAGLHEEGGRLHVHGTDSRSAADVKPTAERNGASLTEALEFAKADLNCEKKHVAELEEILRDKERQLETMKLEHSKQIKEMRTQVLDMKSQVSVHVHPKLHI